MRMNEVDICNMAIGLCGSSDFIQSLTDTTSTSALRCNQFFKSSVESVLRKHDWHCAEGRQKLAKNTASPVFEYENAFAIPFDCARIIKVYGDSNGYSPYDRWHVQGRGLITDLDAVYLKYVKFPSDYKDLDILLSKAIAYELALMLAPSLFKDKEMYGILFQAGQTVLREAKAMDTLENKDAYVENNRWEDARIGA